MLKDLQYMFVELGMPNLLACFFFFKLIYLVVPGLSCGRWAP